MTLPSDKSRSTSEFVENLESAKCGSINSLGSLLEACRHYLAQIANQELTPALATKVGASDLVQDTFLAARRDFSQFRGATEAELLGWLREILLNRLRTLRRRYVQAAKRSVRLEVSLGGDYFPSADAVLAKKPTPSRFLMREELKEHVKAALARLPKRYREVIDLRHRQNIPFGGIARHFDLTPDAARQLWARAIKRMRKELRAVELT